VDTFLTNSREAQPETYLEACSEKTILEELEVRFTTGQTSLMSLPCSWEEDARTKMLKTIPAGEKLSIVGSIRNADDRKWYIVSYDGVEGYLFTGDTRPESWFTKFRELITGK